MGFPAARSQGVTRRILPALEQIARCAEYNLLRLETGVRQLEALRLFINMEFVRTGPFGDYPDDPLSIFMKKDLTRPILPGDTGIRISPGPRS